MSISLLLPNITAAIASINVTGVTIRDTNNWSVAYPLAPNVLYPNPEGFLTNFSLQYQSFTRGASALVDVRYTLNYRFLGSAIGDNATIVTGWSDMIDKLTSIIAKMIEVTAPYDGRVDMEVAEVTVGARADPAGNMYHGADIAMTVTEMQNAS
jgi:hypothetical protein